MIARNLLITGGLLVNTLSQAGPLTVPHEFQSGARALASEVNQNFTAVAAEINDNSSRIDTKQNRVSGTCSNGTALSAINEDGSVTCQGFAVTQSPYRVVLQQGFDNYTGTRDTSLYKVPEAFNPTPGTANQLYTEYQADASTGRIALLHFDLTSVLGDAQAFLQQWNPAYTINDCNTQISVRDAKLQILGIPGGGTNGNTPAFWLRYFSPGAPLFDETTANWDNANTGETWNKSGSTIESFDDLIGGVFDAKDMPTSSFGRFYSFNVLPGIVKEWLCNPNTNKGLALEVIGGGTGGSMKFFSSEVAEQDNRPKLIIDMGLQ